MLKFFCCVQVYHYDVFIVHIENIGQVVPLRKRQSARIPVDMLASVHQDTNQSQLLLQTDPTNDRSPHISNILVSDQLTPDVEQQQSISSPVLDQSHHLIQTEHVETTNESSSHKSDLAHQAATISGVVEETAGM